MWKFAAELTPLAYAGVAFMVLTLIWVARNAREIWFVLVSSAAIGIAVASFRRQKGSLVIRIGDASTLSYRPKHQR
jgi:hypothetical protein